MKAKSIKGKSPDEIQIALEQSLVGGFKPTLAIVFVSIKQDHTAICGILGEAGIAVFGASTNGEFIDEDTMTGGIAILLLDMNRAYFTVFFDEFPEFFTTHASLKSLNLNCAWYKHLIDDILNIFTLKALKSVDFA